jgi:hypothetical protein
MRTLSVSNGQCSSVSVMPVSAPASAAPPTDSLAEVCIGGQVKSVRNEAMEWVGISRIFDEMNTMECAGRFQGPCPRRRKGRRPNYNRPG